MNFSTFSLTLAGAVLLAGCATKDYVNTHVSEKITAVNARMDGQHAENSEKFTKAAADRKALEQRVTAKQAEMQTKMQAEMQAKIETASNTAKEALERASAAGKLAQGKFMYETTVSSQLAFDFGTSKLSAGMMSKLDEFAAKLKAENKNVYIEIQGHTDRSGSDAANLKIAQERAEAVRNYLAIKGGIALHRINAISYGESAPIADNKTRAGRIENRRVTLVVLQ